MAALDKAVKLNAAQRSVSGHVVKVNKSFYNAPAKFELKPVEKPAEKAVAEPVAPKKPVVLKANPFQPRVSPEPARLNHKRCCESRRLRPPPRGDGVRKFIGMLSQAQAADPDGNGACNGVYNGACDGAC